MTAAPATTPTPPRRTRRGEERDLQIRARASELFLERGYDGVSLDDIVRDVGGSKTNLYNFYGGKDGLFLAVVDELIRDIVHPLQSLSLDRLGLKAGLRAFATTMLDVLLQERHLAVQRLVIAEALRHPQIASNWYRNGPRATHEVLERFFRDLQAGGHIRPSTDPARAAVLFHDMVIFDLLNRAMMAIDGGPAPHEIALTIRDAVTTMTDALDAAR
jgi:AcrR family transcriptional regulator